MSRCVRSGNLQALVFVCALGVAGVLFVACGSAATLEEEVSTGASLLTATTVEPTVSSTSSSPGSAVEQAADGSATPTIDDLADLAAATVEKPLMSFELVVTRSFPGSEHPVVTTRTGSFDDETFFGVGTLTNFSEDPSIEGFSGDIFEFRLVDETLWFLNPLAQPPQWSGFDINDFAEMAGAQGPEELLANVDADSYLGGLFDYSMVIDSIEPHPQGTSWNVVVDASALVPMTSGAAALGRLTEAGALNSELTSKVEILQSEDGDITGFNADMNDWWLETLTAQLELEGLDASTLLEDEQTTMTIQFLMEPFEQSLVVTAPCIEPELAVDGDLTAEICDAQE